MAEIKKNEIYEVRIEDMAMTVRVSVKLTDTRCLLKMRSLAMWRK